MCICMSRVLILRMVFLGGQMILTVNNYTVKAALKPWWKDAAYKMPNLSH